MRSILLSTILLIAVGCGRVETPPQLPVPPTPEPIPTPPAESKFEADGRTANLKCVIKPGYKATAKEMTEYFALAVELADKQ